MNRPSMTDSNTDAGGVGLLARARQFVADSGCDEDDMDVNLARVELLQEIDAAIRSTPVRCDEPVAVARPCPRAGCLEVVGDTKDIEWDQGLCTDCGKWFWRASAATPHPRSDAVTEDDWSDDPSCDEKWNSGVDFAMTRLCIVLGVDPQSVGWDAATETVDGDVQSVIGNIMRAKYGEDWDSKAFSPPPSGVRGALEEKAWLVEQDGRWWGPPCSRWDWARAIETPDLWTADANKAMRFSRRDDAEAYMSFEGLSGGAKATEHIWLSTGTLADLTATTRVKSHDRTDQQTWGNNHGKSYL